MRLEQGLRELTKLRRSDDGFSGRPGGAPRVEATAWAVLALRAGGESTGTLRPHLDWLAARQAEDGRVPLDPAHPGVMWPTPLAMLAWDSGTAYTAPMRKAAGFLLSHTGRHFPKEPDSPLGHDTGLKGWPWVLDTHSWVVPTSLCMIALCRAGHGAHERVREAARMLADRRIPAGGWGYGNTTAFGSVLRPFPDTTGAALCALAAAGDSETARQALPYLEQEVERVRTPLSLGWALLGLASWDRRPAQAEVWAEECLARQEYLGPYETASLVVLLFAALAGRGFRQESPGTQSHG